MSEHVFADPEDYLSTAPREPNLEELLTRATEMRQANRATQWALGNIAAEAREAFGKTALGKLAEVMGVSVRWVQKLAQVSTAYSQDERSAYPELGWALFAVAMRTDDPIHWLNQANDNHWSERELRLAIRGERPPSNAVERLLKRVETILQSGGDGADSLTDGLLRLVRRHTQ